MLQFSFDSTKAIVGVGSDGGASFSLTGPGIAIFGFGGINCLDWCGPEFLFPPGSGSPVGFGLDGQIFLGGDLVVIGCKQLDEDTLDLSPFLALNTSGGFVFPMNPTGSEFTACQPASMPSFFTGSAGSGDDFVNFNLTMPAGGKFCSTWLYSPPFEEFPGGFQFDGGKFTATTVPEPGTLGLMSVGAASVIGSILRKRKGLSKSVQ